MVAAKPIEYVRRAIRALNGHIVLAVPGICQVSGLTVAKTAAKLGLLYLIYVYVSFMVDFVGGDTLRAVKKGQKPPHLLFGSHDLKRMQQIPTEIMRTIDSLDRTAQERLRSAATTTTD